MPLNALLVGSIPLADAEAVFRQLAGTVGDRVPRVPDGETGARRYWIHCQNEVLAGNPHFEAVPREVDPRDKRTDGTVPPPRFRLRNGAAADGVTIGPLGYARWAIDSFHTLRRLKTEGVAPRGWRLQVNLPTPHAFVQHLVAHADQAKVEPIYEKRMIEELGQILAEIPADELAVQWDVASEFASLEGVRPSYYRDIWPDIIARLARLGDAVPGNVELGFHLCYGDLGHRHFTEPADMGKLVTVMNGLAASISRRITWFHLPVPRGRDDAAYFAPLSGLHIDPGTEIYMGLIHLTDGVEGARRRAAAARRYLPSFGIATECGFGRRPAETVPALLALHRTLMDGLNEAVPASDAATQ